MPDLRLALAQVNPTVGDLAGNARIVLEACRMAHRSGARLVAFPEMVLTGYPIEDLALRASFIEASRQTATRLALDLGTEGLGSMHVVVGLLDGREGAAEHLGIPRNEPVNAAWVLHGGHVVARYAKHHLPNYGVFDEYRYFVPGEQPCVFEIDGTRVSLAICEDLWQDGGPVRWSAAEGADLLLVINGSPYERAKDDVRFELCQRRAREARMTLAYVNMVGGQDELVFDGDSMIVDRAGVLLARAPQFEEYVLSTTVSLPDRSAAPDADPGNPDADPGDPDGDRPDTGASDAEPQPAAVGADRVPQRETPAGQPPAGEGRSQPIDTIALPTGFTVGDGGETPVLGADAEVYSALVLGLRDYVHKNGFGSVVLGLSGGIDSALVAAIACDALGPHHVHGVSMPSKYSSEHSRQDAADLAERTGLRYRVVPIEPMFAAFDDAMQLAGLAEENLQARVRGVILMGISNAEGPLVLATGNKTELSVGYSTIYGDAVGGFAPIKDVPKMDVWALARWRNDLARSRGETEPIPRRSIDKPPSAELRPGQLDTDSLPDYQLLDQLLDGYVELDRGADYLIEKGFDPHLVERVLHMTDAAEYKRRQYPPGTKVSLRAFGRDRRLPITNRWRERRE